MRTVDHDCHPCSNKSEVCNEVVATTLSRGPAEWAVTVALIIV
jgi:hypothetical protein